MADTQASAFGDIPALDLTNDRIPIIDVSASGNAKNKLVSPEALFGAIVLSTPKVIHVQPDGNDSTGNGTINAPYLTGQKAYDEGLSAAVTFTINFGPGSYTIGAEQLSSLLRGVSGVQSGSYNAPLTVLAITATPALTVSGGGESSNGCYLGVQAIDLNLVCGGGASGDSTGGAGGAIHLTGDANTRVYVSALGGDGTGDSSGGVVNLIGPMLVVLVDVSGDGPSPVGGTINAFGCDMRQVTLTGATTQNFGGCAFTGSVPGTDKGGNSIW